MGRALDERLPHMIAQSVDVDALRSSISELATQVAELQSKEAERNQVLQSLRHELAAMKLAPPEISSRARAESGVMGDSDTAYVY